jgi:hypothetical protein
MLSLEAVGRPLAIVHGGSDDGEIISVVTENKNDIHNYGYEDEDDYYSDEGDNEDTFKEIEFDDGLVVQLPNELTRDIVYIAGPSGSGKSTYASSYAQKYRKMFPQSQIYIFSRLEKDPAFDGMFRPPPIRMKIDEALITHPIDVTQQLKGGCLVIFDDIDTIIDEKLKKAVIKLETDILEIGRHNKIYIICCSHLINGNDKKFSRTILNEATTITVFPKSGSSYQINYCLKNYYGLPKKKIDSILALDSRWITLIKGYPQICMYEHGIFVL